MAITITKSGETQTSTEAVENLIFDISDWKISTTAYYSQPKTLIIRVLTGAIGYEIVKKNQTAPTMTNATLFSAVDELPPITFNPTFEEVYIKSTIGDTYSVNITSGVSVVSPVGYQSWIFPFFGGSGLASTSQTATAGRCLWEEFEITATQKVNGIAIYNFATVAGNARVAIYGPLSTREDPVGSLLLVQSDDTALLGSGTGQIISFDETTLVSGLYIASVQYSDATHTYARHSNITPVLGWSGYFDQTYGAFPAVCPAVTKTGTSMPSIRIKGISI